MRRNISLPIAAQSDLNQVIAYELDKYVPLIQEQAYFATQILGKNKENNQIYAELVCLPKAKLDHYYQEFYDWGLILDAICYDYGVEYFKSQAQSKKHNLLPEHLSPKRRNLAKLSTQALTVLFSLSLIVAVVYPLWLQSNRIDALQQQVSEAKT
ncbi:hypothetical protein [Methylocucumis oryzae]|uniref:Uncharacterized protein n=1 Tax=Methylocucumis oryzae TaxID=1632867 RepID=A0A0F3IIU2_9GAMM|nr:hypothetical protein [Methylocucumis oryzae]KJV06478.1 hypothetical protein VZ94_10930 [Methylocucumis oryzae]